MRVVPPRRRLQVVVARPTPEPRPQRVASQATAIAAIGALIVSALGMVFTARSVDVAADSATATREQVRLLRQGQVADRFARAVEQLGSAQINVRFGAIYSLESLMRESDSDQATIVSVLSGFIREQTKEKPPAPYVPPVLLSPLSPEPVQTDTPRLPTDVQAALTVLGRRDNPLDTGYLIDLSGVNLSGADLMLGNFSTARFEGASLRGANLTGGHFGGTDFIRADLAFATAIKADMAGAHLDFARLYGASFMQADLSRAFALRADSRSAAFTSADLTDATFNATLLSGSFFYAADLRRAKFQQAELGEALFDGAKNIETATFACARGAKARGLPPNKLTC